MTCHCPQCSKEPQPTYTEEFRHIKEVEFVAKHSGAWIKNYLDGILKERGAAEYHRLRNAVLIEYEKLKN